MDEERARILKMIETGSISAEQGLALMNAMEGRKWKGESRKR